MIIDIIIWILIIWFVVFGIDCFIHPPKGDYGQTSGFAFGVAVELFVIYLLLNDKL